MRNLVLTLLLFVSIIGTATAQFSAQAGLTYQTKVEKLGIQLKGQYGLSEVLEGALGLNFIFTENGPGVKTTLTEINLDGHYIVLQNDNLTVYPLAGLNFTRSRVKFDDSLFGNAFSTSATKVGLNLGGGVRVPLTEVIQLVGEVRGVLASDNGSRLGIFGGVHYSF